LYLYSEKLAELCANGFQCPPVGAGAIHMNAWRWVANPISDECFSPVAVRNPPRLLRATDIDEKCSCWGLSMHSTYDESVSAFQSIQRSFRNIRKVLGGSSASLTITPSDGSCTAADRYGHFDFHPFANNSLRNSVSDVRAIP